jgi:putative Ig domain-containing protein/transmembrane protein TMEM131
MTKRVSSFLVGLSGVVLLASSVFASTNAVIFPTGLSFNPQVSGTTSAVQLVTVYNLGQTSVAVNTVTSNLSQFQVVGATLPVTIAAGQYQSFNVQFAPDSAKSFSGKLTFTFSGLANQTVNLSGNGTSAAAIPTLSATSLTFGNQPLGTASAPQTLTITNTGTTAFKVTGVTVTYPFYQTGWTSSTKISPGGSLKLQVTFFPTTIATVPGTILFTYDIAPNNGVSLWGSGVSGTALGISTFPTLPTGSQNSAYQATLTAAGGTPPYTWTLASGSSLPAGLTLSASGIVSGSLASSVGAGSYTFTVQVTDSATSPSTVNLQLTLPVAAVSGNKNCNTISFNASDGSGPLVPIDDLGTKLYLGSEAGGLYANGSNVDDAGHDSYGQSLAAGIQPLDANGNPSSTGKYVFISVGLSITQQAFGQFVTMANADPSKNPNLVIVDGATGGATASLFAAPNNNFWNVMTVDYLPNAGVTAKQVVAAWVLDVNGGPSGIFPSDMTKLQANLESIAQNLLTKFPNIKIAYYSSMHYTGYSNGFQTLNPEPYGYESGFAVKNVIQDQINGNSNLNFDPAKGTVEAPWLAWGPYLWANGMIPRSDGLVWTCQDLDNDGTHPSNPAGRVKYSTLLLNFLKTDPTATTWFLAH